MRNKAIKKVVSFINRSDGTVNEKIIRSGIWIGISFGGVTILTILRSIILARLLMPEIFGIISICSIVLRFIEVFSQTGFGAALISRQDNFEEAKNTAFSLLVLRGFILAFIAFFISSFAEDYYGREILKDAIKLISITFIIDGFRNINLIAHQKELNFKFISYLNLATSIVTTIIIIVLAYYLKNVWALVYGQIFTSLINVILSYTLVPGRPIFSFKKEIIKELFKYGKYITGLSVILFFASELDNLVIGRVLGLDILGYYVIAYTLANLTTTHISKVISNIMFPAFSKLQNDNLALKNTYLNSLKFISFLAMPAAGGLMILAPEIIKIVYGEKWIHSIEPLQILCLFGVFRSLSSLNGYFFNGIGKPYISFYISILRLIILALLIYPLTVKFILVGVSIAVTLPMSIQFFLGIYILANEIKLKLLDVIKIISISISYTIIMILIIMVVKGLFDNIDLSELIVLIMIGIFAYAIFQSKEVLSLIKTAKKNLK